MRLLVPCDFSGKLYFMEPHPVPQDILNTEFKLFGSFTLKQFLKMLFGCLFALFIYLTPIPAILKWPFIGISITLGIALAIVPRFDVKLSGFVKAIFISPRYIWMKNSKTPDILNYQQKSTKPQPKINPERRSNLPPKQMTEDEISIEKLLSANSPAEKMLITQNTQQSNSSEPSTARDQNIDRMFQNVYTNVAENENDKNNYDVSKMSQGELIKEIQRLRTALNQLVKDEHYKEKESEILSQINELYQATKSTDVPVNDQLTPGLNMQGSSDIKGQSVFGIVVDKADRPIANAKIYFDEADNAKDRVIITGPDGKFGTQGKLGYGNYTVKVEHPNYRFDPYIIQVGPSTLPAFKLRSR